MVSFSKSKKVKKASEKYSEVDNEYFIREDFLNQEKLTTLDESRVEDLVRLYNAEQILLRNRRMM